MIPKSWFRKLRSYCHCPSTSLTDEKRLRVFHAAKSATADAKKVEKDIYFFFIFFMSFFQRWRSFLLFSWNGIENWDCNVLTQLISGAERNFHKYPRSTIDTLGTRYDYGSLMHYTSTAFTKNGGPTIVPKRSGVCYTMVAWQRVVNILLCLNQIK